MLMILLFFSTKVESFMSKRTMDHSSWILPNGRSGADGLQGAPSSIEPQSTFMILRLWLRNSRTAVRWRFVSDIKQSWRSLYSERTKLLAHSQFAVPSRGHFQKSKLS